MSILIKGMEMPKGCIGCRFCEHGSINEWDLYCGIDNKHVGNWDDKHINNGWRRPDCPLVEVPTPHGRWIPVSERLPDDLEEVIVTWVNHNPEPYYAFLKDKSFTGAAVYYRGDWYWYSCICTDILTEYGTNGMDKVDDGVEITAWMPLPEPYKEESNEEEGEEA